MLEMFDATEFRICSENKMYRKCIAEENIVIVILKRKNIN
jgi:hypothetical protein